MLVLLINQYLFKQIKGICKRRLIILKQKLRKEAKLERRMKNEMRNGFLIKIYFGNLFENGQLLQLNKS